jgi:hypothetical protein
MELIIKKVVAEEIGFEFFEPFGAEEDAWASWRTQYALDLADLTTPQVIKLQKGLEPKRKVSGVPTLLWDINNWLKILENGETGRHCRTVHQYEVLLGRYLMTVTGHRLYERHDDESWLCYYVSDISYSPPEPARRDYSAVPASVEMTLAYEAVGGVSTREVTFYAEDCIEMPVEETLIKKGYLIETEELRKNYLETRKRFRQVAPTIGTQYWATGRGSIINGEHSYRRTVDYLELEHDGEASHVVVDVFHEEGEEGRDRDTYISDYFWPNILRKADYDPKTDTLKKRKNSKKKDDEDDGFDDDEGPDADDEGLILDEDTMVDRPKTEIPIHPWIRIFDLQRHTRLQVHVNQLTEYEYDTNIAEKLILPNDQKQLVKLLIDTGGGVFKDIVRGKGGGVVVLLTGPPGTGKTLTAEVYAESEERALYSIQCSQLGTEPENLEEELLTVFARAKRWNAVILLDEADVYIHARGTNLQQNAIVGVFLRVLEYQTATMFLTSNRPQDIDDAIASRCIARLDYLSPTAEMAKAIWKVLTKNSAIKMAAGEITKTVRDHPDMTGRDIKNIIKLAALMPEAKGGITAKMASYVHQFKPTGV